MVSKALFSTNVLSLPFGFPWEKNQHKDLQVNKIYIYIMCNYNFLLYKYYDHGRKLISINFSKIRFKLKT